MVILYLYIKRVSSVYLYLIYTTNWWLGGVVLGRWTCNGQVVSSIPDLGQVVHTNVPLFTKQYNLVTCEGFHVNTPVCGSHSWVQ